MTRRIFIEQIRRLIYGSQPSDDAEITVGLVNVWLDQAIGVAAQRSYMDALKIDGITYVNNSFYTTYKSLSISQDDLFIWKITLPQVPIGIGENLGVETLVIKDSDSSQLSYPIVFLTQKQRGFSRSMRPIPNKVLGYMEGEFIYLQSTLLLSQYTAQATMISGGLSTDLDSTLNIPADYFPIMTEYLKAQLMFQRQVPQDVTNDGLDAITTT